MKHTKSPNFRPSALSLALISMVMAGSLNAGMIDNSNNVAAGGFLGGCTSTPGSKIADGACVGAMNLGNVDVQ
jgi:hypothetical protein